MLIRGAPLGSVASGLALRPPRQRGPALLRRFAVPAHGPVFWMALAAWPVRIDYDATERLPAPVELVAYFVVSEALTNVAKYARATSAAVRVSASAGVLSVQVADDGAGGADPARGSGLRGLRDRVEALDGRLGMHSPPGGGTVVTAELPCG
jgi:signal transduction histidine kinase